MASEVLASGVVCGGKGAAKESLDITSNRLVKIWRSDILRGKLCQAALVEPRKLAILIASSISPRADRISSLNDSASP